MSSTADAFASRWETAVGTRDHAALLELLSEDVSFRSPAVHRPYAGRDTVGALLALVGEVFGPFAYTAVYTSANGLVMQFETTVAADDGRVLELEGVDVFGLDESGCASALTVMIRPLSGLQALVAAIAARLEQQ